MQKRILVGITGGIAAYKGAELVRRLRDYGANVRVVMTEHAKQFITPLTLQALSGHPVADDLFDVQAEAAMGHIELARWAELLVIAPASANSIAKLAYGHADNLLMTLCLATQASIWIAPAMNQVMWQAPQTQENIVRLCARGVRVLLPDEGVQACGDVGRGRMQEPAAILAKILQSNQGNAACSIKGRRVLVTAGPTHETIDPVRYITNGSSGRMGYALAEAASHAGARVTLISGPVALAKPDNCLCVDVVSARDMYHAVMKNIANCDIFLAVAAVSDYRSKEVALQKIHKTDATIQLEFERNPDIVASVATLSPRPFIVGFAAETENVLQQAYAKRRAKQMDVIVANRIAKAVGMGTPDNTVTVISNKRQKSFPLMPKQQLAYELLAVIAEEYEDHLLLSTDSKSNLE